MLLTPGVVAAASAWAPLAIPENAQWKKLRNLSSAIFGEEHTEAAAKWLWEQANREEKVPFCPENYVVGRVNILF